MGDGAGQNRVYIATLIQQDSRGAQCGTVRHAAQSAQQGRLVPWRGWSLKTALRASLGLRAPRPVLQAVILSPNGTTIWSSRRATPRPHTFSLLGHPHADCYWFEIPADAT